MKTNKLVVFYSLDGNTKFAAEKIAAETGADILEIKPKKEVPSNPVGKYVLGGFKALFKVKSELEPLKFNPDDYSVIWLGTPVWAGRMTPPLRSWIAEQNLEDKTIKLFCTCRADSGKTLSEMKQLLEPKNKIKSELEFVTPLKNKAETEETIKTQLEG